MSIFSSHHCLSRSLPLSLFLSDALEILTKSIYKTNIYQLTSRPLSKLFSPQRSFSQCIWTMFMFDISLPASFSGSLSSYPLFWYQINIRLNSVFYLKFLKKTATLFLPWYLHQLYGEGARSFTVFAEQKCLRKKRVCCWRWDENWLCTHTLHSKFIHAIKSDDEDVQNGFDDDHLKHECKYSNRLQCLI